jgi:hypothetical protein
MKSNIIKHIVIPGGGPTGIQAIGALQHLEQNGFWNINNIETIYSTSAGSITAVLLSLKFDWETINDYIIKRPWNEAFHLGIDEIFEAYSKKGLFDKSITEIFYKPFFDAKDISMTVTMKEFFELTKIELHFFSLDINHFNLEDISYLTHPDLELLTAVQMSSAIPVIISPVCIDDKCYVDGGIVCNYPINHCILRAENKDEIFGMRNIYAEKDENHVKKNSTLLEYVMNFINKLVNTVSIKFENQDTLERVPNELIYNTEFMSFSNLKLALSSSEERKRLLDTGREYAIKFLLEKNNEVELGTQLAQLNDG